MRDIYHNDKMRKLAKPVFKAVELRRAMRSLSLGLGGGCPDGKEYNETFKCNWRLRGFH